MAVDFDVTSFRRGRYERIKDVGRGAYSQVVLVRDIVSGERRVIKRVYDLDLSAKNEVEILRKVRDHPNIVKFYDSFSEREGGTSVLHIVMEYCEGGDLSQFLQNRTPPNWIPGRTLADWFSQLLLGVAHLHERHVLHRDLKTANIFLTRSGTNLKIADFGISRSLSRSQCATTMVGTPFYMAPEVVNLDVKDGYNEKSDVWSLAVIMYELCALQLPFPGTNVLAVASGIMNNKPAPLPEHAPTVMKALLFSMLETDAGKRPTVKDVLDKWQDKTPVDKPHEPRKQDDDMESTAPQCAAKAIRDGVRDAMNGKVIAAGLAREAQGGSAGGDDGGSTPGLTPAASHHSSGSERVSSGVPSPASAHTHVALPKRRSSGSSSSHTPPSSAKPNSGIHNQPKKGSGERDRTTVSAPLQRRSPGSPRTLAKRVTKPVRSTSEREGGPPSDRASHTSALKKVRRRSVEAAPKPLSVAPTPSVPPPPPSDNPTSPKKRAIDGNLAPTTPTQRLRDDPPVGSPSDREKKPHLNRVLFSGEVEEKERKGVRASSSPVRRQGAVLRSKSAEGGGKRKVVARCDPVRRRVVVPVVAKEKQARVRSVSEKVPSQTNGEWGGAAGSGPGAGLNTGRRLDKLQQLLTQERDDESRRLGSLAITPRSTAPQPQPQPARREEAHTRQHSLPQHAHSNSPPAVRRTPAKKPSASPLRPARETQLSPPRSAANVRPEARERDRERGEREREREVSGSGGGASLSSMSSSSHSVAVNPNDVETLMRKCQLVCVKRCSIDTFEFFECARTHILPTFSFISTVLREGDKAYL